MIKNLKTPSNILLELASKYYDKGLQNIDPLDEDGSKRKNFVISCEEEKCLGVWFENVKTNKRFISYAKYFSKVGLAVPKILSVALDSKAYLCSYHGRKTLAKHLENLNAKKIYETYTTLLPWISQFHKLGKNLVTKPFKHQRFNFKLYQADLDYCIKHLVTAMQYNHLLNSDFEVTSKKLILKLASFKNTGFVYRDFQARNIMLASKQFYFIDFQDGKFGPDMYDLASLLFASSSNLNLDAKESLWLFYFKKDFSSELQNQFFHMALIRKLRSLGTYANLGNVQGKANFKGKLKSLFSDLSFLQKTFKQFSDEYQPIFRSLERIRIHLS